MMKSFELPPLPWYREPWPWLLMAGPAAVIVAGVITTTLAITSADGVVADDYYKQGLMINQRLQRDQRAVTLGVTALVQYAADSGRVRVRVEGAAAPVLVMRLTHPTRAGFDQLVRLTPVAPGLYEGPLALPAHGRWRVVVETPEWRLAGPWDGRGTLKLISLAP